MTAAAVLAPPPRTACHRTCGVRAQRRQIPTTDGTLLAVHDSGPASAGHTVIFLHGLCLNHQTWTPQINRLQAEYGAQLRLISYDHRGHGESASADPATYTIAQLGEDLRYLLGELEVTPPVTMVAHSMGGMAVLAYLTASACRRSVIPHGLVLAATAAGKLSRRGIGRLLSTPATDAVAYTVTHSPDTLVRGLTKPVCAALAHLAHRLPTNDFAPMALAALTTTAACTAVGYLPSLRSYDHYATLSTITARTVIVSGGADPITPPQHARDMAAAIPDAVHWHVPRAGHMLPGQAPDVITAAIKHAAALGAPTTRPPRLCTARNVTHAPASPPHLPPAPEPASAAKPALLKYVTEGTQ